MGSDRIYAVGQWFGMHLTSWQNPYEIACLIRWNKRQDCSVGIGSVFTKKWQIESVVLVDFLLVNFIENIRQCSSTQYAKKAKPINLKQHNENKPEVSCITRMMDYWRWHTIICGSWWDWMKFAKSSFACIMMECIHTQTPQGQGARRCTMLYEHSSNWRSCWYWCWCWCWSREHWDAQCYVSNPITHADRSQINRVPGHQVKKLQSNWHMISKWFWLIESMWKSMF